MFVLLIYNVFADNQMNRKCNQIIFNTHKNMVKNRSLFA